MEDYYKKHACCPNCGCSKIEQTLVCYIDVPDRNKAYCINCEWEGIVDDLVPEKDYGTTLLDAILAKKEAKEKLEEEEKAKKLSEATQDETDPRFWSVETTAQYITWIFQKKSPQEIEATMNIILDTLKG